MPLAFRKKIDPDTSFALWRIRETAAELYGQLQLNAQERAYLETLNNGKRSLHWLSTRVLLRTMLNTGSYIDCRVDENGKPYLPGLPVQISLSHSVDFAAVMISGSKQVGIDIEIIENKIGRIAHKFLTGDELSFIEPAKRIEHLYACWCAKEAIYKLQGTRGVSFLEDIRIHPFTYAGEGYFTATLQRNGKSQNFRVDYQGFENYMIGYAAGITEEPE